MIEIIIGIGCAAIIFLIIIYNASGAGCEHIWRFGGHGVRAALVPEWIFKCKQCGKSRWRAEGCFPDEESYQFYKEKMGEDFKEEWTYVVSESMNQIVISRNLARIKEGTYFDERGDVNEEA